MVDGIKPKVCPFRLINVKRDLDNYNDFLEKASCVFDDCVLFIDDECIFPKMLSILGKIDTSINISAS